MDPSFGRKRFFLSFLFVWQVCPVSSVIVRACWSRQIIDPYAGIEIQYSTPCFSFAAITLVVREEDISPPAKAFHPQPAVVKPRAQGVPVGFKLPQPFVAHRPMGGTTPPMLRACWRMQNWRWMLP